MFLNLGTWTDIAPTSTKVRPCVRDKIIASRCTPSPDFRIYRSATCMLNPALSHLRLASDDDGTHGEGDPARRRPARGRSAPPLGDAEDRRGRG